MYPHNNPPRFVTAPPGEWFVGRVTVVHAGTPQTYEFDEWWMDGDGTWEAKTGGRVATSENVGYTLPNADGTEQTLAVNDYALVRLAPGAGNLLYEMLPLASASASATSPIKARVAATGNVTVSNPGTSLFDGVTLSAGDVLFLPFQTAGAENGPYTFNGSTSALTRHADADTSAELVNCEVVVSEGAKNADTKWLCTTDAPITVDTTALTWERTYPSEVFALVTVTDTGAGHTVKERTWTGTSTAPGDGSPTVTYSPCYSTTGTALPVNTVVTVERHPIIPGAYAITPAGYADTGLPGLVSTAFQSVSGLKEFQGGVQCSIVNGPNPDNLGLFPNSYLGSFGLPSSHAAAAAPYAAIAPMTDATVNFLGDWSVYPTLQWAMMSGYGGSSSELWCFPSIAAAGGNDAGRFVMSGHYAVFWATDGKVYSGESGTVYGAGEYKNGILTGTGLAAPGADSIMGYSAGPPGAAAWFTCGGGLEFSGTTIQITNQGAVSGLSDATGGTAGSTLAATGDTTLSDQSGVINNNFASVAATLSDLIGKLQSAGIIS